METEIPIKETETQTEEKKSEKSRAGRTTITSVSLSDEFRDIVDTYNLSPTDVFRRGVAVTLADLGEAPYNTKMNNKRLEAVRSKLELDKMEKLVIYLEEITKNLKEVLSETKQTFK